MSIGNQIKNRRLHLGLTQVEVAACARVSLLTYQQVENRASNPSLETLEKIGSVLNFSIQLATRRCDWDRLSLHGLPITSLPPLQRVERSHGALVLELKCALLELTERMDQVDQRKQEAVAGLMLAILEYFPGVFTSEFNKNETALKIIQEPSGKIIKLKRIAVATLSEYL